MCIYMLSLHVALPISGGQQRRAGRPGVGGLAVSVGGPRRIRPGGSAGGGRGDQGSGDRPFRWAGLGGPRRIRPGGSAGGGRRDQGPGAFPFEDPGQVEQQRVLVVAADDLEPDREAVDGACGEGDRRVPTTLAGMVRAPLLSGPTAWSPTRRLKVTSAGNATSGLVAQMTKSTSSNTSAMRSLQSVRRDSHVAARSRLNTFSAISSPKAISNVSWSRAPGQRSPSSRRICARLDMAHS